jgi:hypothetical protein
VPCSRVGRRSEGFSVEEGGIFLVFLIHSAARCSASSNCSMAIVLLTWFLARVICYLHWLILVSRQGSDRPLSRRCPLAHPLFPIALACVVEQ